MGNRHNIEVYSPRIINPSQNPNLHMEFRDGVLEYTPNATGMELRFGSAPIVVGQNGYTVERELLEIHTVLPIALLPDPRDSVPVEVATNLQAKKLVAKHAPTILSTLRPSDNVIVCEHGRFWGLLPELELMTLLQKVGLNSPMVFPKVGGRNRIQDHAVLILR